MRAVDDSPSSPFATQLWHDSFPLTGRTKAQPQPNRPMMRCLWRSSMDGKGWGDPNSTKRVTTRRWRRRRSGQRHGEILFPNRTACHGQGLAKAQPASDAVKGSGDGRWGVSKPYQKPEPPAATGRARVSGHFPSPDGPRDQPTRRTAKWALTSVTEARMWQHVERAGTGPAPIIFGQERRQFVAVADFGALKLPQMHPY